MDNGHCTPHLFLLRIPACISVSIVVLYLFDQYVPVLTGVAIPVSAYSYKPILLMVDYYLN